MADFRKLFLALIAGALLFTAVASAQPYSCNANAVPTLGRSEGIAEMTGDVLLVCIGAIPAGGIQANIRYRLTQNITSDLEDKDATPPITEALLILDEGADGFRGTGSAAGQQNVYQAGKISNDEIEWTGVWLAAPGSAAFKVIRLTNIRGNAQAAGDFGTLFATINIVSPTSVPVNNAVLRVMDTRPGLNFSVTDKTYRNCESPSSSTLMRLKFAEGYAASFKPKGTAGSAPNDVTGGGYMNESGFRPGSLVSGSLTGSPGQANHATRLMARFKNIPAGVTLKVPVRVTTSSGLNAVLVSTPDSDGGAGTLGDPTTALVAGELYSAISQVVPSSGLIVYDVYEITPASYATQETLSVPVTASFSVPGPLGVGTVNGNFAPISTTYTMSASAYEPRFVDKATDTTIITINPCRTIILFPYVTNQAGFDTGIAIANTTKDPFGTAAQSGTCAINYYGNTNGSTGPTAQTSPEVGSGAHLAFMLSGGGGVFAYNGGFTACASGACVAPLFQGYIIAVCNFQFAHGYAFISDLGVDTIAQGYLALLIPDRIDSKTGRFPDPVSASGSGTGEQLVN